MDYSESLQKDQQALEYRFRTIVGNTWHYFWVKRDTLLVSANLGRNLTIIETSQFAKIGI